MSREYEDVRREVAVANRVLSELGLATGALMSLGHASMRMPSQQDRFVVKGRGYAIDALAAMRPEDMVMCDLEGYKVDGPIGTTPCGEVKMHSCIYKARPDVQGIVHVHPRFTVIMAILGVTLAPMCNEGNELVREPLPVFPHSRLILSEDDGREVAETLGDYRAVILRGHGAATVGPSVDSAVMTMLNLEEQAKMNWYGYCAAGRDYPHIPEDDTEEWLEMFKRMPELPHMKAALEQSGWWTPDLNKGGGGVWRYYADKVAKDM